MPKKGRIVWRTAKELAAQRARGETRSDWARARAMSPTEIEQDIASDPDEAGMVVDWDRVSIELPKPKADLHMRVDRDVLDWFKRHGKGYQTRINAVLRSYVARMRQQ
ncbi:MAG TPA: BrnA antitoxin family protein [Acetobacteraceae bacterium]|nr:BrnA antitoxin family protein [Acetobacteraceae bacterium]